MVAEEIFWIEFFTRHFPIVREGAVIATGKLARGNQELSDVRRDSIQHGVGNARNQIADQSTFVGKWRGFAFQIFVIQVAQIAGKVLIGFKDFGLDWPDK